MATTFIPTFSETVGSSLAIEPLGGPKDVSYYLEQRFPDELYSKSPSSRLFRFMSALLGPQGVNGLRKNYLQARIMLEERGSELFDLDGFFGNPFAFSRILEESFSDDPVGLIPYDQWQEITAKNARYRNRALDFLAGVRAGNSPFGMSLVAKAGLGHAVEVIENYQYLYNIHSDDPLDIRYWGKTLSTEEFIILPRREVSQSETQQIEIRGIPDLPDSGSFYLSWNGNTAPTPVQWNDEAFVVRSILESIPGIQSGDVEVSGGPGPDTPWRVLFTGGLAHRDITELQIVSSTLANTGNSDSNISIRVYTLMGGVESVDEIVEIPARDHFHLQEALFRIKPMTAIPSISQDRGDKSRALWSDVHATSEFTRVLRYVKGSGSVVWPQLSDTDPVHWIEKGVEHEAPRLIDDLQHHYQGYHNVATITAYGEAALNDSSYESDSSVLGNYLSEHVGRFNLPHRVTYPFLQQFTDDLEVFSAEDGLAAYPSGPLLARTSKEIQPGRIVTFVDGIYPLDYFDLDGIPSLKMPNDAFWASIERTEGSEYIEIDFGKPQAVNFISFDISRKPLQIDVAYDTLDQGSERHFTAVTPVYPYTNAVTFDAQNLNPWNTTTLFFTNGKGEMIYTRVLRLSFQRLIDPLTPFLFNPLSGTLAPWSVDVKNLVVGRSV